MGVCRTCRWANEIEVTATHELPNVICIQAVAGNTTIQNSVMFNGPRAGINFNDVRAVSRSIPPPWGVNPISSGSPHVRPTGRTCGEPDEIKKNTHPKKFTALFRD